MTVSRTADTVGEHEAHEAGKCPAFGTICRNCGKRNHFARVCRQNTVAAQRPGGQRQKPASRPARVNAVEEEASRWVNSAQSAYDETDEVFGFDLCSAFGSDAAKGSKWLIKTSMRVTGGDDQWTEITAQLDTGSTCNVMTSGTLCRLAPDDVAVEAEIL